MVQSIPDLISEFDRKQLTEILVLMLQRLPKNQLALEKLSTMRELIHSPLFEHSECRAVMLPEVAHLIRDIMRTEDVDGRVRNT